MFSRRLLILVAVLMGLTALAASIAPPPERGRRPGATPTATPTPPAEPSAGAGSSVVARHLDTTRGTSEPRIDLRVGQTLELTVDVGAPDAVELDDLAIEAADAGSPAEMQLLADTPGTYALRLVQSGRRVGVVRVTR
jgi:hypothetical protein